MTEAYTIYRRRYDEIPVAGKPLGRHVMVDSRSAAYVFRPVATVPVMSTTWTRNAPIFDQGNLGSCTGNAITGALSCAPLWPALPKGHPTLDEAEAVRLYGLATQLDGYPGSYPPDDSGSDGTSACKAAQRSGLISGYLHAATLDAMLQALMAGPVIMGLDWYDSFDYPDTSGVVDIEPGAVVRGGHEVLARGVHTDAKLIMLDNSWGTSWGAAGSFYMHYETVASLLASDGDCTVPLPLSSPVPTPTPVPGPGADSADLLLADAFRYDDWLTRHHVGANGYVNRAAKVWMQTKQL